jgi:hypothetical protein
LSRQHTNYSVAQWYLGGRQRLCGLSTTTSTGLIKLRSCQFMHEQFFHAMAHKVAEFSSTFTTKAKSVYV